MNDPVLRGPAFRDPSRPLPERVADLLGRLTLDEKIAFLHQYQPAVPRLGVAPFRTGTEALHGVAWLGPATVFPQAIGLAASWDPDLVRDVGHAVGDEVRGCHAKDPSGAGLNVWAPVVNPLRDPRWGRNEEGYAEDPYLTGVMGTAYAGGLRGDHPTYLRTAPTLKHFLGYNNEVDRDLTSSGLPPRVLHEYELPAFRAPIQAGAAVAVMASYNLVNGRPAHVTPLIGETLRRWTDDEILVVSDAQGPSNLVERQAYFDDHVSSHAAAVRAGIDSFTDNNADPSATIERVTGALDRGLLTESDVDTAVRRSLTIRFRLGEFDPPEANPYSRITEDVINCPAHQTLAHRAARQSVVLLKNADGLLPLAADRVGRVAVLGPLADTLFADWYSGTLPYRVTARDGVAERIGTDATLYAEGVDRVALREVGTGRYVLASPGDGPLRLATASRTDPRIGFDAFDWGQGVYALRAANGRFVSAAEPTADGAGGELHNDQPGPNGWVVRQTFRFVTPPAGDGAEDGVALLRHEATGGLVTVTPDGALRVEVGGDTPFRFVVELLVDGVATAAATAAEADVAIVVVGNHPLINGRETEDRVDLALPPSQDALVRAVHAANPATVLVAMSSYPYSLDWADAHLPALLWSAHGGQEYGHGLTDVLFGDADPGGRLTQTWYHSAADLPDLLDYDIITSDATYLYLRDTPLYPFGHGLSYTTFEVRDLRLSEAQIDARGEVTVTVDVVNTGTRTGEEVVQLYTRQLDSRVKQPLRQLRGFARIGLAPGERGTVTLSLRAGDLAHWDVTRGRFTVESTRHAVMVGRSATDLALSVPLTVRGERIPPRSGLNRPIRAVDHDEYAGVVLVAENQTLGDAVEALHPGAWIAFRDTDLGRRPATVGAQVRLHPTGTAPEAIGGHVTLRLEDPLDGPIVAALAVPETGDRYRWATIFGAVTEGGLAGGVHDLYVVFDAAGIGLSSFEFGGAR